MYLYEIGSTSYEGNEHILLLHEKEFAETEVDEMVAQACAPIVQEEIDRWRKELSQAEDIRYHDPEIPGHIYMYTCVCEHGARSRLSENMESMFGFKPAKYTYEKYFSDNINLHLVEDNILGHTSSLANRICEILGITKTQEEFYKEKAERMSSWVENK